MSRLEQLKARINKLFESEIEQEDHEQARSVVEIKRQEDGRYRWFSISATAAINKDGQIDSRELFDTMVAVARMTGKYPKRDFMHLGDMGEQFHVGQTDFMARDGNTLITSGLYFDNDLATMEIQARQRNPDFWGDSIQYTPLDHPEVEEIGDSAVPVWRVGKIKFVSTVPRSIAASLFVTGEVKEAKRMLKGMELDAFVSLFGDEDAAKSWLEANADGINRLIEDEAIITRSVDEVEETIVLEAEAKQVVESTTTTDADADAEMQYVNVETTVELDDAAVGEVARRVAEADAVKALFTPLIERISQLEDSVEALSSELKERDKTEGVLQDKVAELQRSEEAKFIEMIDDYPRKPPVTFTYRPRTNTNDEVDASLADQADSAIESWGSDGFYNS